MPYGEFGKKKFFKKGIDLYSSNEKGLTTFDTPGDVLNYIIDNHGANALDVIYGFAAESILNGKKIQGLLPLQYLQEAGIVIGDNPELSEMLNRVCKIGEKRQKEIDRENITVVKTPESDEISN